jgi:anti-sigma B factor antagonist
VKDQPSSKFIRATKAEMIASDVFEITPKGEMVTGTIEFVEQMIQGAFGKDTYKIILNLKDTTYITSSGVGLIIASTEVARRNGGNVILAGVLPKVKNVFDMLGLAHALLFAANSQDALKHFEKKS